MKRVASQVKAADKQIAQYEATIVKENQRLEKDTESKREETQRQLTGARDNVAAAEAAVKDIRDQISALEKDSRRYKDAGTAVENKQKDLRKEVLDCDTAIQNCIRADQDRYAAYGNNIQGVVAKIKQTRWQGQTPLGPFGTHVRVRDNKWADLLRSQLGPLLCSFAVTDTRDIPVLKKILTDSKNPNISIHKFQPDLFDYSRGEPPADVLTVLRALEISDPHVLRIMINKAGIEARVLAHKRVDAGPILAKMRSGTAWTLDKFTVTRYPYVSPVCVVLR
ncbi:hypothetical protein C8R45DRAFT_816363 [Mycena sanguinolenta]|nr:hypothetical protein C8R45DRAFT_816363 [Mycena sanguinolenta]